jgi:hypothetical protein
MNAHAPSISGWRSRRMSLLLAEDPGFLGGEFRIGQDALTVQPT